ncbi:MAG: RNA polymerase sporulation sigma factor SigK [Agathobacter sp.]
MKTFLVPLSPEEEKDCLARLENGEREAREDLILHNMRLVAHVAKKYAGSKEDPEDLISIGTIGLLKAVGSFRADYGSRFATYAIRCIDNELLMYFRSRKKLRSEVSLFEPIGTDKEGNQIELVDVLEYQGKNVAEELYRQEQIRRIRENIGNILDEREAFIIQRRYGLGGREEWTQRRIAAALGISRSYVSRIEKRALEKLKKIIAE